MTYDFSFDRRSLIVLGACALLVCCLIAVGGYLVGSRHPLDSVPIAVAEPKLEPGKQDPATGTSPAPAAEKSQAPVAVQTPPAATTPPPAATEGLDPSADQKETPPGYVLQYGAFRERENAAEEVKRLKTRSITAAISVERNAAGKSYFVVRGNSYSDMQAAAAAARRLQKDMGITAVIRRPGSL